MAPDHVRTFRKSKPAFSVTGNSTLCKISGTNYVVEVVGMNEAGEPVEVTDDLATDR